MTFRLSLARMMGLVLIVAIGLAAAMAGAFSFAVVLLSGASLLALFRRGPSRAFLLGFAASGWAFMLLAFGPGPDIRNALPTIRPIVRAYEAIRGPTPGSFATQDEAQRWIVRLVDEVNRAITVGHSLIAIILAFAGGVVSWLVARRRIRMDKRDEPKTLAGGAD